MYEPYGVTVEDVTKALKDISDLLADFRNRECYRLSDLDFRVISTTPREYSDKLRKKRVVVPATNVKGFYIHPRNYTRQYR